MIEESEISTLRKLGNSACMCDDANLNIHGKLLLVALERFLSLRRESAKVSWMKEMRFRERQIKRGFSRQSLRGF
jgi:hypothetical protein